eukprot:CAMPEP_0117036750 /NCGR_PEP_ID=MMETSP0472-20121206/26002_1 /TAXON_ID=693140 ORGANISM="Tiarina fusus, Strain LIS" /NCGR_SAMPLE_ID=MMETSP0472 /ASSEMBLY_ACC=CAM_ASM_000603 /LENGTH=164 /DNA_ID=CAMNT_0004746575 /DNA_START=163 /DNA_END=657 /DNA_ORIENTATION=-
MFRYQLRLVAARLLVVDIGHLFRLAIRLESIRIFGTTIDGILSKYLDAVLLFSRLLLSLLRHVSIVRSMLFAVQSRLVIVVVAHCQAVHDDIQGGFDKRDCRGGLSFSAWDVIETLVDGDFVETRVVLRDVYRLSRMWVQYGHVDRGHERIYGSGIDSFRMKED